RQAESVIEVIPKEEKAKRERHKILLYDWIIKGYTTPVIKQLEEYNYNPWDKLTNNENTVLHVAVGSSTMNHELLKKLLDRTPTENTLLDMKNIDGSTLLHVAAIGGNIEAVNIGKELVVLAISCQDFSLAKMIINEYPGAILWDSDAVLTTLAQNFPRELNYWERRDFMEEVGDRIEAYEHTVKRVAEYFNRTFWSCLLTMLLEKFIFGFCIIVTAFGLLLKAIVHPFIKDMSQVYEDARSLLVDGFTIPSPLRISGAVSVAIAISVVDLRPVGGVGAIIRLPNAMEAVLTLRTIFIRSVPPVRQLLPRERSLKLVLSGLDLVVLGELRDSGHNGGRVSHCTYFFESNP
nr:hypothetical protein [Tanacetum cinerariifolium]